MSDKKHKIKQQKLKESIRVGLVTNGKERKKKSVSEWTKQKERQEAEAETKREGAYGT